MELKMRINKAIYSAQILGVFDINDESKVRFIVEGAGPSNVIQIRARLFGQPNFIALETITGSENKVINVFTYEEVQVECTTFDATGAEIKIYAASFSEAGGSAIESIGVPSGDPITDFSSLILDSSDNSITITGDNTTKTIDFVANVGAAGYTPDTPADWSPAPTTVSEGLDQLAERMVDVETNKIDSTEKGAPSGVAPLNALSKIDSTYLPSYVDDVEEYANLAAFPPTGESSKIYVALDTNKTYRWATTVYVEVSPSAVTSVNGQTGIVVLTKSDVGLGNVDNTSDLDKPVSTATQTAINNLSSSFKYNQVVYVDKANTNVYVADGSINKPYKTIEAMYTAITDASASKRYACMIAPGTYTEASTIRLKGWIDLVSFATDTVIIAVSGGATLKWSNNNPGRLFIKDIGFTSGLEILNDNPSGTSGLVFDLNNVDAPSLIFNGRGGGRDFIQLRNDTRISGSCTIRSAATTIFDSTGIGTLTMNDVGCTVPDSFGSAITASIRSNYIGAISISATTYDIYTDIWGTIVAGNLTIASNASSYPCYYNYDATSYPLGTVTLTGTNPAQLVRTSKAESIRYTPAIGANWIDPDPTEVKGALDSLAARATSLQTDVNNKVSKAGDTMTGQLTMQDASILSDYTITSGHPNTVEISGGGIVLDRTVGAVDYTASLTPDTLTINLLDNVSLNFNTNISVSTLNPLAGVIEVTVNDFGNQLDSNITIDSQSLIYDVTDNNTGINTKGFLGAGFLDLQTNQPSGAYVDIYGDSSGISMTQYDGIATTTPLMPVLPEHVTVKEYVDNLVGSGETGILERFEIMKEPTGFPNRTSSTTSFNDSTREFTIAPVAASYEVYVQGDKFIKTTSETIAISNTSGNHYIYFNSLGNLASTQVISSDLFQDNALISVVYWNSDTSSHTYFAEERHGLTMDGATHSYLHTVFGSRYLSGLALQGFSVDGDGNSASHAQFTADSGSIRDEDLLITMLAQSQIPVLYRQGQLWRKKAADSFPIIYSGTAGYTGASGRLPYNQFTGGAWQLTEVANNGFVLVHVFGTNDKETPIVAIQGIATYGNVTAARLAASSEITSLSGLPFAEFVAVGSVVFESASGYTNTPKAIIRSVNGGDYVDFRGTQLYTPAGEPTTHSLLSNLSSDDHLQYHTDARGDIRYYTKTQIDTDVIKKAGTTAFTGDQSMGGFKLTNLANPVALTDAVNLQTLNAALGSSGDIFEKSFSLLNNQSPAANITDFVFANGTVRSFEAIVSVSITATSNVYETFEIRGIQKASDWFISINSEGDNTGIIFSITSAGQMQYVTPNYPGFVSGVLKFRAITTSV